MHAERAPPPRRSAGGSLAQLDVYPRPVSDGPTELTPRGAWRRSKSSPQRSESGPVTGHQAGSVKVGQLFRPIALVLT